MGIKIRDESHGFGTNDEHSRKRPRSIMDCSARRGIKIKEMNMKKRKETS
jgi:hypothetical protein